jgi:hypothetical protein
VGNCDFHGDGRREERHSFQCSVDFNTGVVRSVKVD